MTSMPTRAPEATVDGGRCDATVNHHCLSPARTATDRWPAAWSYARLLQELPSFRASDDFLLSLGRAGGPCDCGSRDDERASLGTEAAGRPFVGQFIAHDITADRSALASHVDPARLLVGEVLVGLLDLDERLVRFAPPDWRAPVRLAELLSWSEGMA